MIRCRFRTKADDYRPITWPIPHPYWCSGQGDDYFVIVAYADDEKQVLAQWPEAYDLNSEDVNAYVFTERFAKPGWFVGPVTEPK